MKSKGEIREAIDEFLKLIEEYQDALVIVEGKEDKSALIKLGFTNIITLSTPLYKVVESVKTKKVIVLTDLDSEGKKLYSKLKHELGQRGVYIDDKLRNLLFKTDLRQLEGLFTYLSKFNNEQDI